MSQNHPSLTVHTKPRRRIDTGEIQLKRELGDVAEKAVQEHLQKLREQQASYLQHEILTALSQLHTKLDVLTGNAALERRVLQRINDELNKT